MVGQTWNSLQGCFTLGARKVLSLAGAGQISTELIWNKKMPLDFNLRWFCFGVSCSILGVSVQPGILYVGFVYLGTKLSAF